MQGGKALRFSLPVWIALAWTGILALAIALGLPFGVPGEWVWAQRNDLRFPLSVSLFTLFCLTGLVGIVWQATKHFRKGWIIGALLLAFALRFCFASLQPRGWGSPSVFWTLVILSPIATSFFTEAKQVEEQGIGNYLRHYHETLPSKPVHAATHPPGLPLLFAFWRQVTKVDALNRFVPMDEITVSELRKFYGELFALPKRDYRLLQEWEVRSAWWAAVLCLSFSLASVAIWGGLMPLTGGNGKGIVDFALFATTPAFLWWIPTVDSIHLFVVLAVLFCALQWQRIDKGQSSALGLRSNWFWATMTGLFAGSALWLAFKNAIPIGCILLWLMWEHLAKGKEHRAWSIEHGARKRVMGQWLLVTVLSAAPYLLAWLLFGFQPLATLKAASAAHHAQAGTYARSYLPWVVMNLLDFAMGMGGAWLGLTVVYLWHWWRHKRWQPSLTVVTLAVLLLLNFSGMVRGEAARLWLPFVPLLVLETSDFPFPRNGQPQAFALLVALQCILALSLHLRLEFLRPW